MRTFATFFAALLGLAFGSFLNVCLSRWPYGESIVRPGSHCRNCEHTLSWWENTPLLSWLILRGRCQNCHTAISFRYPLVELLVAVLWAAAVWNHSRLATPFLIIESILAMMIFYWLLVALAFLDAEHFWLPDLLTLGGTLLGIANYFYSIFEHSVAEFPAHMHWEPYAYRLLECAIAASIILLVRWLYWLVRRQEGMGLGDAKLMAMLAAWLGLPNALLSLFIGVTLGALWSVYLLIGGRKQSHQENAQEEAHPTNWALTHLPLGTFLCLGVVISSFFGTRIIAAYLHWAGL